MKATELRIGNEVLYNGKPISISIVGLREFYYLEDTHANSEIDKRCYEPILLTEEWLLKFGFEHKSGNEYIKGRFTYRKQQRDIVINGFEYDYNGILISAQDMHVHEFQNLFYTIEREELEIKETVTP